MTMTTTMTDCFLFGVDFRHPGDDGVCELGSHGQFPDLEGRPKIIYLSSVLKITILSLCHF
jgi:hypothetical protein